MSRDVERALEGRWAVRRESGLLPPFGVAKEIAAGRGRTTLLGVPVAWFRIDGTTLAYRGIPVLDELVPVGAGRWRGAGYVLGVRFCTFLLEPSGDGRDQPQRRDRPGPD